MSKKTKLTPKEFLLGILACCIYLVFVRTSDKILIYPDKLFYYYPSLALAFIILCFRFKVIRIEAVKFKTYLEKAFFVVIQILTALFISLFVVGALLIPLNYYNIESSRQHKIETYDCEISRVVNYSGSHSISFIFRNKYEQINADASSISEIATDEKYGNYTLTVAVKKGLMDTYILQDWGFKHK